MPAYPKRPQFYSLRFMRVLFKSCAALEIGPGAVCLLVVVASTEDSKRYSGEVLFWNDHLRSLAGFRSEEALATARKRAIDAGWLHYEPGGKHKAGRYWVTIPPRLEVLDDAPVGDQDLPPRADGALIESPSPRSGAGREPVDSGSTAGSPAIKPPSPRSGAGREPVDSGSTAGHSCLSQYPIPIPVPNAAEPRLDPTEQDITTPSVPRSDVPRGPENDTVPVDANPEWVARSLGVWVRWRTNDASRQAENLATLVQLIRDHGAKTVQQAAECLQRAGDPARDRAAGEKCWPDEILPWLLRAKASTSLTIDRGTAGAPTPAQSPIVVQAHALLAQHGAVACRTALGWPATTAPTDAAMRAALEREAVASDLVDAFANGPIVVVTH